MSFLIDPPWLYASGRALGQLMPEETPASRAASRATLGAFMVTSLSLYANLRWTRWIWRLCRADDGRDWMLNSGVLRLDHKRVSRRTHTISALIFTTYPLWLWLGERAGRGRHD
jgi:hypothetical protein